MTMEKEQIVKNFITEMCFENPDAEKVIFKDLHLVLNENKDIEFSILDNKKVTFYGSLNEKFSDEFILFYKLEMEIELFFDFILFSNWNYFDYYTNLTYCLSEAYDDDENDENDLFTYVFLSDNSSIPEDLNCHLKDLIGKENYDLFIDFMLTETNNKLKNAIYKVY